MRGESLYEVYLEEIDKQGTGTGTGTMIEKPPQWAGLMQAERNAWNELAKFVEELVIKGHPG